MKISFNWLKLYIDTEVSIQLICKILTDIGLLVENLKKIKNLNSFQEDYLIELNIPHNRRDVMSHYGIARDLNIALKSRGFQSKIKDLPSVSLFKKEINFKNLKCFIEKNKKCIRYSYTTLSNIKVLDSPNWLKNYLNNIGCISTNNILDIENFILYELGKPIRIYDLDKIKNFSLSLKESPKQFWFNKNFFSSKNDLILFNEKNPICIAGLLVNNNFIVEKFTKNLFLESADYSAEYIYKIAKKYNIKNEFSIRLERGLDPNLNIYALKRAALLIKKLSGGKISSKIVDFYPEKPENNIDLFIRFNKINKIIGYNLNFIKIKEILILLKIKVLKENFNGLKIKIPLYRKDITREIDVIEEILRIYGYNNFNCKEKISFYCKKINFILKKENMIENMISNQLNSHGFYEILNSSLTEKKYSNYENNNFYEKIFIFNSKKKNFSFLRDNLLFGILEKISSNKNKYKFFEWGKKYFFYKKNILENKTLGIICAKNNNSFFKFKGIIEQLIIRCGINVDNKKIYKDLLIENGISFNYKKNIICNIGYIKKAILEEFEIFHNILYADINWDIIILLLKKEEKSVFKKKYHKYNFTLSRRDISLLIDKKISFEEIKKLSFYKENKILKKINLLDEYNSKTFSFGKKSYTLSFFFQNFQNNLTETIIEKTINKLKFIFIKKIKAIIR
ncbi:phenylalanine--tRNA ligase subunit beta [Candidatus Karelsulcia muelleri]|uniref:phenylalanine--tRNA ligase subunit beta n=1 Tax=Candidatus Karelsulcia muelleri TaxID=336810 RepID=UPI000D7D19C2|nr:phenylalanine--tRNA ligase subunit beta [Candidatus Karelsulcia muelleri]